MKKLLLSVIFSLQLFISWAQWPLEWQRIHAYDPSGSVTDPIGFVTDNNGNSYVVSDRVSSSYVSLITKYNNQGFAEWEKDYPNCYITDYIDHNWDCIQLDIYKNIYFVIQSGGSYYLTKLDSSGNNIYSKPLVTFNGDDMYSLQIDNDNNANIIISDNAKYKFVDSLNQEFDSSAFFRFDPYGKVLAHFEAGNFFFDMQLITDYSRDIYISYQNQDSVNSVSIDNFITKIDSSGKIIWTVNDGLNTIWGKIFFAPDGSLLNVYTGDDYSSGTSGGILKINPVDGSITKRADISYLNSFNVTTDKTGNLYFSVIDSIENEVMKYDYNLNRIYNYRSSFDSTYFVPTSLLLGGNNSLFIVQQSYKNRVKCSIAIECIDSIGNLIFSKLAATTLLPDVDFKADKDSLDNLYICSHFIGQIGIKSYDSSDLMKFCSSCLSGNVSGNVFLDDNQNCKPDSGEEKLSNRVIELLPDQFFCITDSFGNYFFDAIKGPHIVKEILPNKYWKFSCDSLHTITIDSSKSVTNMDFGNTIPEGVNDLSVSIGSTPMRLGFNQYLIINYANNGNVDLNATISLKLDSSFSFISSDDTLAYASSDSLVWNIGRLQSNNSGSIRLLIHISNAAQIGQPFSLIAHISPVVNDINPIDNTDTLSEVIRSSFDPNEKIVYPLSTRNSGIVTTSTPLSYQINFQNTGTDTAFTVVVQDEIDTNLDLSTFKMVSASNLYQLSIINGRTIQWTFNNILLPDRHENEPASHGFLRYNINAKPNITASDINIKNSASIYFDYNVPVGTDTVSLVERGLSFDYTIVNGLIIYPNPTNYESIVAFSLPIQCNTELEMFDLFGRKVSDWELGNLSAGNHYYQLNTLNQYATGLYFIRLRTNSDNYVCKLAIER